MKKAFLIGGSAIAISIIGIFVYRRFVPPYFLIRSYTPSKHSGEYEFGGVKNNFGNSSVVQGGRFGWALDVMVQPDGTTKFDLLYNGKFIKNLAIK